MQSGDAGTPPASLGVDLVIPPTARHGAGLHGAVIRGAVLPRSCTLLDLHPSGFT